MKKQVLCIFLMLALVCALAGCDAPGSGDKDAFLGTWNAAADLVESINESLSEGFGGVDEGLVEYFKISSFEVTLVYTFNKDDTYSICVDDDSLRAAIEHTKDEVKDGAVAYLEDAIAQNELDMTVEELLEASELDLDDLVDSAFDYNEITKTFVDYFNSNGQWKAKDGELYLSESVNAGADDLSELYEITSDGIQLTKPEGSEDEMGIYPLLLKKA